jgi:iron complex transport system substrate-binding protein
VKVVSLLPAATEMMYALGLGDEVVAVSHDCDHPAPVLRKPQITRCEIHGAGLSNAEVDDWVRRTLAERSTLYTIDEPLLRRLEPDVILTQKLCDVCAPSYGSVAHLAATLPTPPAVVNLEPSSLADIFENIRTVAAVLGVGERGEEVVSRLQQRVAEVVGRTSGAPRARCVLLEWLDPPFCSGHWGPELMELAGGFDPLGRRGEDSSRVEWQAVLDSQPEVLVLACCGNTVAQTLEELPALQGNAGWSTVPAVESGHVYALDGGAYFSRPGPRVVDSLELLAGILHPDLFPAWAPERQSPDRVVRIDSASTK